MSRPIAFTALSLMLGIIAAHGGYELFSEAWLKVLPFLCWTVLLLTGGIALWLFLRHSWGILPSREPQAFAILTALFFSSLGAGRYLEERLNLERTWPEQAIMIQGVVRSTPNIHEDYYTFDVQTQHPEGTRIQVTAWHNDKEQILYPTLGDVVSVEGIVKPPRNRGNPDEFDVERWMRQRKISGTLHVNASQLPFHHPTTEERDSWSRWFKAELKALRWREALLERYRQMGLEGDALAVVSAMTLGDKTLLSKDVRSLYSDAGASHLLALSGLHLGIVAALFLMFLQGPLICSRWRFPVGTAMLLLIWSYTLMTGIPVSLLRASLMMTLTIMAQFLDRAGSTLQHLTLAAILMLLMSPMTLFDVGAQLSFLAVAGIGLFHRPMVVALSHRWGLLGWKLQRWRISWIIDLLMISLSAQFLTWPFVAYYFHHIPTYGIVAGILLIPLTTVIIYAALVLLALSAIGVGVSLGTTILTSLITLQMNIMQLECSLPGAVIHDFWSRKAEPQLVVYHNRRCPALHLIASPSQSWVLCPEPDKASDGLRYIAETFWQYRLTANPVILPSRRTLAVGGIKVVMMSFAWEVPQVAKTSVAIPDPQTIDILWLCDDFKGSLVQAAQLMRPRLVVADASLPPWVRHQVHKESTALGWPCYDVAESGALKLRLPLE